MHPMGLFKGKNVDISLVSDQRSESPPSGIIRSKEIVSGPPVVVGPNRDIVEKTEQEAQEDSHNHEEKIDATLSEPLVDEADIRQAVTEEFKLKYQSAFEELAQCIADIRGYRDTIVLNTESKLANLAVDIAEKIIQKQVSVDSDVIKTVCEEAFVKVAGSDRVVFKVHPNDVETMGEFKAYIESKVIGVKKLVVQPDPTIDQGGAIIETDLGFIDITIQEKLSQLLTAFEAVKHP